MAAKGLSVSDIPDMIKTTLPYFANKGNIEVAYELQSYYFLDKVATENKMVVQDGSSIEWTVVLNENGTAEHVGLYAEIDYKQSDVVHNASQRWTWARAYATYEAHELTMNRGASAKAKYIQTKYFSAYKSIANLLEKRAVLTPEDPSDQVNPNGLLWWFSMLGAGQVDYTGGFNGKLARYGDGTTTTVIGGIDAAVEPLWRNWVANHTGMNLRTCETMRLGLIQCEFKPPRNVKEMVRGPRSDLRLLMNQFQQAEYERLVNSGSDGRNGDLSPFRNTVTFRGIPIVGMPTLNNVAYEPIICVNFAKFEICVHANWWMEETDPMVHPNQPFVFRQVISCQYNYRLTNRREGGFILHRPIAA